MTPDEFRALLDEKKEDEEIDYKVEQYPFEGASDGQKSELLYDILAFANATRPGDAHIVIGVENGTFNRIGIDPSDHIDDASLQEFINRRKLNRTIEFSYERVDLDGKSFGLFTISKQRRPFFAKKKYGKVLEGVPYYRQGSATFTADADRVYSWAQLDDADVFGFRDVMVRMTADALDGTCRHIPGISAPLPRSETDEVHAQLGLGNAVLLTGEAGSGKSGIAAELCSSAEADEKTALLIDTRIIAGAENERALSAALELDGGLRAAICQVGTHCGCRLIVDQLDNVAGSSTARALVNVIRHCMRAPGVEIVVTSREAEQLEESAAKTLRDMGFVQISTRSLQIEKARELVTELNFNDPPESIVELATNLLNLELLGAIRENDPEFQFATDADEVVLWENYLETFETRHAAATSAKSAADVMGEAESLAVEACRAGYLTVDTTPSDEFRQLMSLGVIVKMRAASARSYRFKHEKLQDFIYAKRATSHEFLPADVMKEIGPHRSRNVLQWMSLLYEATNSEMYLKFTKASFR